MSKGEISNPTWEYAAGIHIMVLENPDAEESVKEGARKEIIACARYLDQAIARMKDRIGGQDGDS